MRFQRLPLSGKWKGGIREIRFTDAIRSTVLANGRRMCISPKPALHQNGSADRDGFWHKGFARTVLHCAKKFWYIRKNGTSQELCRELCTKNFRHYFRAVTD